MPNKYGTWNVTIYMDDDLDAEIVVLSIMKGFRLESAEAFSRMWELFHLGRTTLGPYTRDIASTKATAFEDFSERHGCYARVDIHEH